MSVSYYPVRVDDPHAVYFNEGMFAADATGAEDAAGVLQRAIDAVHDRHAAAGGEGFGIVFVPSGTYRLGATVDLWRGIRLIGFGPTRPRFVLGANTTGYEGPGGKYMIHFRDARPKAGEAAPDAKNTTFFAGVSNIDFAVGAGNRGAICCRYRVAQLCALEHIDFQVGEGWAAVEAVGNEIADCQFLGGEYGIVTTEGTSAGWQTLLAECLFDGQRRMAIETERCGLTLVECTFRNIPIAIQVRDGKNEQLAVESAWFENIAIAAVDVTGADRPQNQLNVQHAHCRHVPVFMRFRDTGRVVSCREEVYGIELHHGLAVERARDGEWAQEIRTSTTSFVGGSRHPVPGQKATPRPAEWVSVRACGAVGDGVADDTEALRTAIARHDVVYVPMGRYRVTGTLALRGASQLVGLNPGRTEIVVADDTAGWGDADTPRAIIHAPRGGRSAVRGLCVDTGRNRGAVAIHWQAGEGSRIDDVWFGWGGHGSDRKGEDALYSLWVDGGGGVITNVWSANILTRNGVYVSRATGNLHLRLVSVEHHRDVEVRVEESDGVTFSALQTEENLGSGQACSVEVVNCGRVEFLNYFAYRVISQTAGYPYAIRVAGSPGVRFYGMHIFSWGKFPFDNAVYDADRDTYVPMREVGMLVLRAPLGEIVFVGDSLTEGEGVPTAECFVGRIAGRHHAGSVHNQGRGGWATTTYLSRWPEVASQISAGADTVVLQIGANDLRIDGHSDATVAATAANIRELVTRLRARCPRATFHLMTPAMIFPEELSPRLREAGFGRRTPEHIRKLRDAYRVVAHEMGLGFIDLTTTLAPGETLDGAHPNAAGHAKLAETIWAALTA